MIPVNIANRKELSGYRILIIAIAVSFTWHIFCLFGVKIVSSPAPKSPVKFSKVAFLGPILSTISMEVRAAPASRSFLEKRFCEIAGMAAFAKEEPDIPPDLRFDNRNGGHIADRRLSAVIDSVVSGEKFEPDFQAE